MMKSSKAAFWRDVEASQEAIIASIDDYFVAVAQDFDLVREESVARESEQDPRFRDVVAESVREGWQIIEEAKEAVSLPS